MNSHRAHLILVTACVLWGSGNVAQKTILEHMGPFMASSLTCFLGGLALLPLARREQSGASTHRRPGRLELLVTVLYFVFANTVLQVAYAGTSVSNAGFLVNTCAAMTPVAAWFILREVPSMVTGPSVILVLAGIWLMGNASFAALAWGDTLCILSAALFAVSVPLVSRYVLLYGRPAQLTSIQFLAAGAISLVLALMLEPVDVRAIASAWPELLMLGLLSKGLAYFLMAYAQQHTSASATSVIVSAEAVFGALFAAVLLGERMSTLSLSGAALILLSILILNVYPQRFDLRTTMAAMRTPDKSGSRRKQQVSSLWNRSKQSGVLEKAG